jgi:phage baseplate assembly protein W
MELVNGKHLSFPFRIGNDGRMAVVNTLEEHIHDEIIQLILTNPGERPSLVDFGGGIRRLVFEAADDATAAMAKAGITQAINRWLGHRVTLEYVDVKTENATIWVDIRYRIAGTEDTRVLRFQRNGG